MFEVWVLAVSMPMVGGSGLGTKAGFICIINSKDSNEAEVMVVLEAIWIYSSQIQEKLIIESNFPNAISQVSGLNEGPWKFYFHLDEVKALSSSLQVVFKHVGRTAKSMVDLLAKQGMDRQNPFLAFML